MPRGTNNVAERVRFELTNACASAVFKASRKPLAMLVTVGILLGGELVSQAATAPTPSTLLPPPAALPDFSQTPRHLAHHADVAGGDRRPLPHPWPAVSPTPIAVEPASTTCESPHTSSTWQSSQSSQ